MRNKTLKMVFALIALVVNSATTLLILVDKIALEEFAMIITTFNSALFGIYSWYVKEDVKEQNIKLKSLIDVMSKENERLKK